MKKMPPVTSQELAAIDGMGIQRVAISGEMILATIYAFLEVSQLITGLAVRTMYLRSVLFSCNHHDC